MEINLLKLLKYATLSIALSFSVNANSTFTYEQFQEANNVLKESIFEKLNHNINNNRLVMLNSFEMPILSINENELQELGINNDNVKNIVQQINILKNNLNTEINERIIPVLQNDDFEDNNESLVQMQILLSKLDTMQDALEGMNSGKFTNNMYRQLVDYELINDLNNNKLSNVEQEIGMTKSFGTILQEIKNEEELNEKTRIIKQFYLLLKEKNYGNLETLIGKADQDVLNNINEILDIQEVKDYIQSYDVDKSDITINYIKSFFSNEFNVDFSKTLQENKEKFFNEYEKALEKAYNINIKPNLEKFRDIMTPLYNSNKNGVKNSILGKLIMCHNVKTEIIVNKIRQTIKENENIFKEVWNKQSKSQPLNKLLNADFDLDTIQEEINKAENIDDKNQAIQKNFIETIFGNRFKNLSTILTSNNDEDLEKVYNILNSEKVKKYMNSDKIQFYASDYTKQYYNSDKQYDKKIDNIKTYEKYMLDKFREYKITVIENISQGDNVNITNDYAKNIKVLLKDIGYDTIIKNIENEENKLKKNPYKYFFDNLIINK